jgi:hypothetical protein
MPPAKKSGVSGLAKTKQKLPRFKTALTRETREALKMHGQWWFGKMADRFRFPLVEFPNRNNNEGLHNRTGALRRSLKYKASGAQLKGMMLRMFSESPYAATQEFGGVIRSKGKMMTIPIADNLTPTGRRRYESIRSPEIADGFFYKTRNNLFWVDDNQRGDLKFYFLLKKKVDIAGPMSQRDRRPSRLGMRDTALSKRSIDLLRSRLRKGAVRAVVSATGGKISGVGRG